MRVVAELHHPWGAAWENGPVLVCRAPRVSLQEAWPRLRHWS